MEILDVAALIRGTLGRCNVRLLDDHNFQKYRRNGQHEYFGGNFKMFPARIIVPYTGRWHVTIDLGGGSANIRQH
jgi:hypothetical protein